MRILAAALIAITFVWAAPAQAYKKPPKWNDYKAEVMERKFEPRQVIAVKLIPAVTREARERWLKWKRDVERHERWLAAQRAAREQESVSVASSGPDTSVVTGDVWWSLALCESGGQQDAYNPEGPFLGYFQFLLSTWNSLSSVPDGDPRQFPYEVQLRGAKENQARSGWGQWPACARKLGLY